MEAFRAVGAMRADRGLRHLIFLDCKTLHSCSSEPDFHYAIATQPDIAEVNRVKRINICLEMKDTSSPWLDIHNYTKKPRANTW
jgi:hypothetical protein